MKAVRRNLRNRWSNKNCFCSEELAEGGSFSNQKPMHRAYEELCKIAKNELGADGVLIHMLLGKLKEGDIPANVRDSN